MVKVIDSYRWAPTGMSYLLKLKNNDEVIHTDASCFNQLHHYCGIVEIHLTFPTCTISKQYYKFYLEYISDMYKLEGVVITANGFIFNAFPLYLQNMIVLSTVRFMYEKIGNQVEEGIQTKFLEDLKSVKSEYTSKFENFCYRYKQIPDPNYFHDGHSWKPSKTCIKSYEDFANIDKNKKGVNNFFTNG